mgnify:CR=1 FL=1
MIIHSNVFDYNLAVIGLTYLDMLKEAVWTKIRTLAARCNNSIELDGAALHITTNVREWLNEKFNGCVISRIMDQPWLVKRSLSLGLLVLECCHGFSKEISSIFFGRIEDIMLDL